MAEIDFYSELVKGVPSGAPPAEPPPTIDFYSELVKGEKPKPAEAAAPPKPDLANPPRSDKPNVASDLVNWVGRTATGAIPAAVDLVTGRDRTEFPDVPEFTGTAEGGPYVTGLPLPQNAAGKLDLIKQTYPDLVPSKDKFGNDMVQIGDQRFYVNKPGLSGNDVDDAVTQGLFALPGSRAMASALSGLGLMGRAVGTGVGSGAGSVAQDVAAGAAGSKQGVSAEQAVVNAALGGAFEFLSPVASAAYRSLTGTRGLLDPRTGMPTAAGRRALQSAGINPEEMTQEFARSFAEQAKRAANPAEAATFAEAQSLPVPVPLTAGQISRAPYDQMTESLMSKGAYGQMPSDIMRGAQQQTEDALRANVDAIQGRMSGGQPTVTRSGEGGIAASGALNQQLDEAAKGVRSAYDAAEKSGPAWAPGEQMMGIETAVRNAAGGFPKEALPELDAVLRGIGEMGADVGGARLPALVSGLERKRGELSNMTMSDKPMERAAARAALRGFDTEVARLVDSSLMQGDTTAVEAWRGARKLRAALGKQFEGDDLIERLTEKVDRGGERSLKVAPEDAANYIFGRSALNTSQFNLTRDLRRMRHQLGEDSPAWNSLREEAFMRLMRSAEGVSDEAGRARKFSGENFAKSFDKSMRESPEVMKILFGEELPTIRQLRNVAVRGTGKVAGGDNPSGTALAQANIVQRLMKLPWLTERGAAALFVVPGVKGAISAAQGVRAYGRTNAAPAARGMAPGATGATGGAAAEDTIYPVD